MEPVPDASSEIMAPFDDITEPAIAALVERFYSKARRDPMIGPVFNAAVEDWDTHLRKFV